MFNYLDLRKLDNNRTIQTDICIVGAGVAGIILALELRHSGKNILLVESGGKETDASTQALYDLGEVGLPFRKNFVNRVRAFGGSCNTWTGRSMPYQNTDMEERNWLTLGKWPFQLPTLDPYYQRAIPYLDLPAYPKFDPTYWYPKLNAVERTFFHNPELAPRVSLWGRKPMRFGFNSKYKKIISRENNIKLLLWANLVNLDIYENYKTVKSAELKSINGKKVKVEAKTFVLACGGLENARLLLLSNQKIPYGLGNQYDHVGRYFMDHPKFEGGILELFQATRLNHFIGHPILSGKIRLGLALNSKIQWQEQLLNPYLTLTPYFRDSLTTNVADSKMTEDQPKSTKTKPHYLRLIRYHLNKALRRPKVTRFKISNYLEQEPNRESRAYLSSQKDALGSPKLVLDWRLGNKELHSIQRLHYYLNKHLEVNRLGSFIQQVDFSKPLALNDASHHIGTTRMSASPENGVVDQNCKVFGLDNLYVAGSSVFPTSGHANPTLTIVALAIRLADYLKTIE